MASLNDFMAQMPRPLPVIIASDRSGSMQVDGKIDALNIAIRELIRSLKDDDTSVDLQVALFSFGGQEATIDFPLTSVSKIKDNQIPVYQASGKTPMGLTFFQMKDLIENKDLIPSRAYKPTIVLITDGKPTDDYRVPMKCLIEEGRSSKAFRMAMAIGADANQKMLASFVSTPEYLVPGENARDIKKFFRYVTMTVTSRTHSQTPDNPPTVPFPDDEIIL